MGRPRWWAPSSATSPRGASKRGGIVGKEGEVARLGPRKRIASPEGAQTKLGGLVPTRQVRRRMGGGRFIGSAAFGLSQRRQQAAGALRLNAFLGATATGAHHRSQTGFGRTRPDREAVVQ